MGSLKLIRNGKIFTSVEGDDALHEAMLIRGDEVVYVGDEAGARSALTQLVSEHLINSALCEISSD
jgi:predicted amidohydrolase YtcJ